MADDVLVLCWQTVVALPFFFEHHQHSHQHGQGGRSVGGGGPSSSGLLVSACAAHALERILSGVTSYLLGR